MADRDINWVRSSYEDLLEFPDDAINAAGFQLRKVQQDEEPDDWKPMPNVGPGVREIRIFAEAGAYRVMYVVKIAGLVHVLHCFHKKTEQTSQRDIEKGRAAYREVEAAMAAARKMKKTTKGRRKKE
ncbi:type II toxin-antitoxin system RelE/ParE family toxin [Taklimakanibacter deserti]|uniref:type II toxin-antitoxin system RelE/ParE family toxin n=1 Tax=Taklimakanibacter deserti TaxID=2267839 RepID=UPI000E656356